MSSSRFVTVEKNFFNGAKHLRQFFDEQFEDPLKGHSKRFVWDYWHVPDQYSHLRTPAQHYFPKSVFDGFLRQLTDWGQQNLGCHAISPPWLSCYIDNCEQKLHCDVPHGPFAFVYSLSLKPGVNFTGGRTLIMKDQAFSFANYSHGKHGLEMPDLFHQIVPQFNQLLVFDPRFPHGVERVQGQPDPRWGRLVVHGWFTEPQPFAEGPLSSKNGFEPVYAELNDLTQSSWFSDHSQLKGCLLLKIQVAPSGRITRIQELTNTLFEQSTDERDIRAFSKRIVSSLSQAQLAKKPKSSLLTLPIVFE